LDLVDHLHPLSRCRVGSRDAATTAQHAPCSAAPQDRSINLFCNAWPHACMHFFFSLRDTRSSRCSRQSTTLDK
jgi:hypothetical protein